MFSSLILLATPFLQMWNRDHMDGDGSWLGMAVVMLVFWATIALVGYWVLRSTHSHASPTAGPSPVDIARERYARGEINDEEFERIKRGLK